MSVRASSLPAPRSPDLVDVCVLFASVVGSWAALRAVTGPPLFGSGAALGFAAASGVMTGLPALAWALDRGRGSLPAMLLAGAAAGLLPPFIVLASGVLRLIVMMGFAATAEVLGAGAAIPARGVLSWGWFLGLVGQTIIVGLVSGAVIWQVGRMRR